MENIDRSTDSETDTENLEVDKGDALVSADNQVPFIETLDAETRALLDEVLERSVMLARDVIVAVNRP
jgi:hypothetical protein